MLKHIPSAKKLKRLNRLQRKKLRVDEFQELVFKVRVAFHQPLDEAAYDPFMDAFIDLIEARRLIERRRDGRPLAISRDGWHRVGVEARFSFRR